MTVALAVKTKQMLKYQRELPPSYSAREGGRRQEITPRVLCLTNGSLIGRKPRCVCIAHPLAPGSREPPNRPARQEEGEPRAASTSCAPLSQPRRQQEPAAEQGHRRGCSRTPSWRVGTGAAAGRRDPRGRGFRNCMLKAFTRVRHGAGCLTLSGSGNTFARPGPRLRGVPGRERSPPPEKS